MFYKIKNFKNKEKDFFLWNEILNKSSDHWFFSSINYNSFHIEYVKDLNLYVDNKSFFVYENESLVAIAVLIFSKDINSNLLKASYLSEPLPWPVISDDCKNRSYVYKLVFDEIQSRIKQSKINIANFAFNSTVFSKKIEDEFIKILKNYNMIDNSYYSHLIEIDDQTINKIRKSYIKNVKKHINEFTIQIIDKSTYYKNLPIDYEALHIQDAGKKVRSLKTYELQLESIKKNSGFAVQVLMRGKLVGMLIIYVEKNSAYDGSVAVCPEYKKKYVSHILKYYAILELNKRNIKFYELGKAAISPSYNWLPDEKNFAISFFKNGWSNNVYKKVFAAEKIYTSDYLKYFSNSKNKKLKSFFKIN